MANRGDIKAGGAFVELMLKDSAFVKGLTGARKRLQSLGGGMMQIGAGITAMGSAIVAPLGAAVSQFVSMGSELADVSARTGVAASSLAELKFAAEQTGSGLGDVEKALKFMAKEGKNVKDFDKVAAGIAAIEDPSERAKVAMETFGKAGTALLPMLENLQALRHEARDAGLVPSDEAVSVADALGDAWDKIKSQSLAALFEIGAAIGPTLIPALKVVSNIATAAINWVKQNQGVVRTVAAIGAGLVAAGVAVTAIGATLFAVGSALGAIVTAVVTVGSVLASPLGIVLALGAAVAAGVAAWLRFTSSGQAAVQKLTSAFQPFLETIKTSIGGIGDALMGGDLQLAGQIAMKSLQVLFLQGIEAIASSIGGTLGGAIGDIGTKVIQGDLAGAWQTAIAGMAKLWADFSQGVVKVFTDAANAVTDRWASTVSSIANGLLKASAQGGVMGKIASLIVGADVGELQRENDRMNQTLGIKQDIFGIGSASIADSTNAISGPIKDFLDQMNVAADDAATEAESKLKTKITAGPSGELQAMQAELERLRAEAAELRTKANAPGGRKPDIGDPAALGELKQAAAVTFSGAGLLALGAGGGPQERMAKGIDKLAKHAEQQAAREERQIKAIENIGLWEA